ncbi:flavin reductase family protein [Paraburkholderia sp. J63]|uniref:flavin reductase family protein n=1 Tax=Paraburkholderia sp. J63 TaxID=2805434 RepID=UPI002ABE8324|nr:flavin reductase family protein [Paraburkholderia sp. J63]
MGSTTAPPDGSVEVQRQFRTALSMFATGVAVITAPRQEGHPIGITVASFNAVSLEPPLILFSVDRRSMSLADLCSAPAYAVNVLEETQQDMSNRFAKANGDKWGWRESVPSTHDAAVLLPDALATFECEPYAQYDGGDHVIFVGRVTRHQARPHGRPLIFFGGCYRSLDAVQTASA